MTKSWLIGTTALVLLAGSAWAAEDKAATPAAAPAMEHGGARGGMMEGMMEGGEHHRIPYKDLTLEQAREHAHKRADKLDKMTQEEWDQHKKQRMERREKWKAMSPEEKQKHKEAMREMRKQHMGEPAPAAGAKPEAK